MIPNTFLNRFTRIALFLSLVMFAHGAHSKNILIFGDSLSAAYGMDLDQGWAHLLGESLGDQHTLTNASISGETSGGGLARLPLTLNELKPELIVIELGANDGLQGLSIDAMRSNLEEMIRLSKSRGIDVALAGISLPASYGPRYIDEFRATYTELATKYELPFIDFYREDFISNPDYIQDDGLHPTAITQPMIRDLMLDFLKQNKLLD